MSNAIFSDPLRVLARHRHVNVNQKRYAVASALAATAVPALVMARGHRVEEVPELPLVVDTSLESCTKTAAALATLTALGAAAEVAKVRRLLAAGAKDTGNAVVCGRGGGRGDSVACPIRGRPQIC